MSPATKTQAEASEALGITAQAIGMWAKRSDAPMKKVKGKMVCRWPEFPRWWREQITKEGRTEARPANLVEAEARKMVADAVLAELKVAEKEGVLIAAQIHDEVVGDICDRLCAVLQNLYGNYGLDLERAGVTPEESQRVLTKIGEDLTGCLRTVADDVDA